MTKAQTKLQVTSEQAIALGEYVGHNGAKLEHFATWSSTYSDVYVSIKDLTIDEMATALFVGYEVKAEEPEFKVGDWVTVASPGTKLSSFEDVSVTQVVGIGHHLELRDVSGYYTRDYLRLSTPNEIFWAELGRKTNELKYGDVVIIGKHVLYQISEGEDGIDSITMEDAGRRLATGSITKLYPVESALGIPQVD